MTDLKRILVLTLILFFQLQPTCGAESIRVVTEPWPPYTYSENGTTSGVVTEIVRATLDRTDLDYSLEVYPWARAYDMALNNKNVLIYSILKLPNRTNHFKWLKIDGLTIDMYLFSPKHRQDIQFDSLEEAKRYRIGVTRETSTHHFLLSKGFVEGKNLFPVNCEEQNTHKSKPESMRIDLTTGDRLSLAHWLSEADLPPDYWVARLPLFHEDIYMAFSHSTPDDIVDTVRRAFRKVKEEGVLKEIVDTYSHTLATRPTQDR